MPSHDWSDESFDWKSLYDAERRITKLAFRFAGIRLCSKEKYGTIRYERFTGLWKHYYWYDGRIKSYWHGIRFFKRIRLRIFELIVYLTCRKYPHVAKEITQHLLDSGKLPWFARRWWDESPWKGSN